MKLLKIILLFVALFNYQAFSQTNYYLGYGGSSTSPYTNWSMATTNFHLIIRLARTGSVINVGEGDFYLTNNVVLTNTAHNGIRILGSTTNPLNHRFNMGPYTIRFVSPITNGELNTLTFQNYKGTNSIGIVGLGGRFGRYENLVFRNNEVTNTTFVSIFDIQSTAHNSIYSNITFNSNIVRGRDRNEATILGVGSPNTILVYNVTFDSNIVTNNNRGMLFYNYSVNDSEYRNFTIINNELGGPYTFNIGFGFAITNLFLDNFTFISNNIGQTGDRGMFYVPSSGSAPSSNLVVNRLYFLKNFPRSGVAGYRDFITQQNNVVPHLSLLNSVFADEPNTNKNRISARGAHLIANNLIVGGTNTFHTSTIVNNIFVSNRVEFTSTIGLYSTNKNNMFVDCTLDINMLTFLDPSSDTTSSWNDVFITLDFNEYRIKKNGAAFETGMIYTDINATTGNAFTNWLLYSEFLGNYRVIGSGIDRGPYEYFDAPLVIPYGDTEELYNELKTVFPKKTQANVERIRINLATFPTNDSGLVRGEWWRDGEIIRVKE